MKASPPMTESLDRCFITRESKQGPSVAWSVTGPFVIVCLLYRSSLFHRDVRELLLGNAALDFVFVVSHVLLNLVTGERWKGFY